jgi:hypothetical protein
VGVAAGAAALELAAGAAGEAEERDLAVHLIGVAGRAADLYLAGSVADELLELLSALRAVVLIDRHVTLRIERQYGEDKYTQEGYICQEPKSRL